MIITNKTDIPLALAVWVVHDDYDYINEPNYISATRLMKPIRHLVLPSRVEASERVADVEDYVSSGLGRSIHDSVEKAWVHGYRVNLKKLGYPDAVIDRVRINPDPEQAKEPGIIPVYLEQRSKRIVEVNGIKYTVGGKFDLVAEGILHDNKSTSAYSWLFGTRDDEHKLQGSIYRWLNPDKVTEDFIRINYIFTDWSKMMARTNPKYPQKRLLYKDIPLFSEAETEDWIVKKIALVTKYKDVPEAQIPECTDEELWRSEPTHKYYLDPTKTSGRSTKNFDSASEAKNYMTNEKGGKGIVITTPGAVKRCGFCDAFPVCTQKDRYEHA